MGDPVTNPKTEPLERPRFGDTHCAYGVIQNSKTKFGWGPCSDDSKRAVVWDGEGRGSCGAHSQALTAGLEP